MNRLLFAGLIAVALAGACKKKEKEAPAPETTAPAGSAAVGTAAGSAETGSAAAGSAAPTTEGSAAGSAATDGAAKAYKPDELFKETAGKSRLDIMERFQDDVTVTGTVKAIKDDPEGAYVVVFDAGDGKTVEAQVMNPKPARDKKLKDGDSVTLANCLVANPSDTMLPLTACQVQ